MTSALILILFSPLILYALYAIGIQYKRGGWWRLVLPVTGIALVLDVALNYTVLAVLTWDRPRHGEWTFSKRLKRLRFNIDWRGPLALFIAQEMLDPLEPDGQHVK